MMKMSSLRSYMQAGGGSAPGSRRNGDLPNRGVITIADEDILNYESSAPWSPTEAPSRKKGKKASSRGGDRNNESTGPSPEGSSKLTHPAQAQEDELIIPPPPLPSSGISIKLNPLATVVVRNQ